MKTYKVAAVLLRYPEPDWLAESPQLERALAQERWFNRRAAAAVAPLLASLRDPLLEVQARYVETFDRQPAHGLYLFEHLHGESRDRGTAMVELLERYRQHGLDLDCDELPDHLPVFLEFLSLLGRQEARRELRPFASVLRLLFGRLQHSGSPYAGVFEVLGRLAPRAAVKDALRPARDMERLLEREGRSAQGDDPLLTPAAVVSESVVPVSQILRRPGPRGERRP